VAGRVLTFHLAGINNQNFLMRDEETGSFWQQINGRAVSGPLAGSQLELVVSDELTFGLWRGEHPAGLVLRPVTEYADEYEKKDWEKSMGRRRSIIDTSKTGVEPRALMLGLEVDGASRAYRLQRVLEQQLVQDVVGGHPLLLVVGPDGKSVRAFSAELPGQRVAPDFYRKPADNTAGLLIDSATGSAWDFQGCAVSGPALGACLRQIPMLKDYWFDWHIYHPRTTVYAR
jgi:hypothetical protein